MFRNVVEFLIKDTSFLIVCVSNYDFTENVSFCLYFFWLINTRANT